MLGRLFAEECLTREQISHHARAKAGELSYKKALDNGALR